MKTVSRERTSHYPSNDTPLSPIEKQLFTLLKNNQLLQDDNHVEISPASAADNYSNILYQVMNSNALNQFH